MIVLAFDTTHDSGSIALSYRSEIVEEAPLYAPDGYSGILFQEIGKILDRNSFALKDVDVYAASAGPGSFTGVRVGLTAAKALSAVHKKPCYGVSTLAAMASFGTAPCRAAVIDARRAEIYGAVFGAPAQPETVMPLARWLAALPVELGELLAFDFTPFEAVLADSLWAHTERTLTPRALAAAIASIALDNFRAGVPGDPARLDANYVRRSDAELLWKGR